MTKMILTSTVTNTIISQGIRLNMFRPVYRSKHVEPLMNGGIINSVPRLHLVGYFYWIMEQYHWNCMQQLAEYNCNCNSKM